MDRRIFSDRIEAARRALEKSRRKKIWKFFYFRVLPVLLFCLIIFIFWPIFHHPENTSCQSYCWPMEIQANTLYGHVIDYYSDPSHEDRVTLEKIIEITDYKPNFERYDITLVITEDYVVKITVTEKEDRELRAEN